MYTIHFTTHVHVRSPIVPFSTTKTRSTFYTVCTLQLSSSLSVFLNCLLAFSNDDRSFSYSSRMSDEVVVREVENPQTESRRRTAEKHRDAAWVNGLQPEPTPEQLARLRAAELAAMESENPFKNREGHWLKWPMIFGIIALVVTLYRLLAAPEILVLEFAVDDVPIWPLLRQITIQDYVTIAVYPIASSLFAGSLCINLGVASDQFILFVGVGFCTLTSLAAMGEVIMLHRACPFPDDTSKECFLPTTMQWVSAFTSHAGPMIAAATTTVIWDRLLPKKPSKIPLWLVLLLTPVLLHVGHALYAYWYKQAEHIVVQLAMGLQVLIWAQLLRRCNRQNPFLIHYEEKKPKVLLKKAKDVLEAGAAVKDKDV